MIYLTLPYPVSAPGVYRITDQVSGKFYIGSSTNVAKRWDQHRLRMQRGTHANPILQAIWRAGPDRLRIETLCECGPVKAEILAAEQQALDAAGVGRNPLCMNVLTVAGSHLGRKRTEATRQALSLANRGKKHTDEAKAKMRAAKLGRKLTEEHKRKVGDANLGKKWPHRKRQPRPEIRVFSDDQVRTIRAAKAAGQSFTQIEAAYGMSRGALQRMLSRKTYSEVQ